MKNAFKLILILCLFVFNYAYSKEVRLLHITDANLNEKNAYQLKQTIKEINKIDNIDFVLFGGNNLAKANIENLNIFQYILRRLHKKTVVLVGSSDVFASNGIDKEYYFRKIKYVKPFHSKKSNYTFKKKGYVFVVMDGAKQYFQSSNGYYSKKELMWLDKTLSKKENKDKNIIILQHFPLLEAEQSWIKTTKMEDYQNLLAKHKNVKMIISGHYDKNLEIKKDGICNIVTESYAKNGAYKIIEIDLDNDFIGTYLIKN